MFLLTAWSGAPRIAQIQAVFFILLILCQELQPVLANLKGGEDGPVDEQQVAEGVAGRSSSGGGANDKRNDSDLETPKLFAQPEPAVIHLATEMGASPRKLDVALGPDWKWPATTKLKFVSPKENRDHEGTDIVEVCAGLRYKSIHINAGEVIGTAHASPVVQLVEGSTDRYKCRDQTFPPRVAVGMTQNGGTAGAAGTQQEVSAAMGKTLSPLDLTRSTNELSTDKAAIVFMHGGQFRLCYSPHGSFGGALGQEVDENVVPTVIKVFGVSSGCNTADGCLQHERWECSFGYKGESFRNCEFNFQTTGATYGKRPGWSVEAGFRSKITWSAKFGPDVYGGNARTVFSTDPKECANANYPPDTSVFGTVVASDMYMHVDHKNSALMPAITSSQSQAFTLAACYCPNYNAETGSHCEYIGGAAACCDGHVEFIQQIGLIYYWTVRLCDYQYYQSCSQSGGASPTSFRYMRIIPHQKFVVRVDCPPGGGCLATNDNRIKLIRYASNNNLPSWNTHAGCRTSFSVQAAEEVWPSTGDPGSGPGGMRLDYKAWRDRQVRIRMTLNKRMDICFANSNPGDAASWFKVGEVQTTRAFALGFRTGTSSTGTLESIKYVGHPGSVTLIGGIMGIDLNPSPFEGNMFSGKALVNVVSYDREKVFGIGDDTKTLEAHYGFDKNMPADFQDRMDSWCQKEAYSPTLVRGPSSKNAAKTFVANVNAADENTVSTFTSFSGPDKDKAMTIKKSGVVAICYCAMVSSSTTDCESSSYWIFAGRITIQGPAGGITFTLPTQVVIKFDLEGWGFSNNDVLRIIPADTTCDAACSTRPGSQPNDPCGATSYKVGCPSSTRGGCSVASSVQNIGASVVTGESAGVYVEAVDVGESQSQLKFTGDITRHLQENDIITLDFGRVKVKGKEMTDTTLTAIERYEAYRLTGEWEFQDTLTEKYQIGHRVSDYYFGTTLQKNRLSIPIGWKSTPTFEFNELGPFGFLGDQGYWTRRNKLSTAEELKGSRPEKNLKLCWGTKANGVDAKYYHEAGIVDFVDPDPMVSASVSLTTTQKGAVAPVVISFKTNPTRSEYSTATGLTMLMLRFLDIPSGGIAGKLEPYKFDTRNAQRGIYDMNNNTGNAEVTAANMKQHICGEIFTELWSSHSEGFPMPIGCHYSKVLLDAGIETVYFREIFITFGELNGIRQGQEYQIVLNALLDDIAANDALVDIYAMCAGFQGCARPYQVFEKGSATASVATQDMASQSDPQFATGLNNPPGDGFMIQLGDALTQVLSLTESNVLQFQLQGADSGSQAQRVIIPNSLIRIYMWPLTSWNMGTGNCNAVCFGYWRLQSRCSGEVGCGYEEVVKSSGKRNIVKIKLPTEMDTIDFLVTHTIKVTGLTLPPEGFFPTKLGVQLTRPEDTRPHYITSTGFVMKQPAVGQTTGRVVISGRSGYGPKPFLADIDNTLYVRIRVGATLWNVGKNNAAFLEILLPQPYASCSVTGAGAPPRDLKVFLQTTDGYVDNNRGVLAVSQDDGNWDNSAERKCSYELGEKNQAIYAGMVMYVALTVVNPSRTLPKTDEKNLWNIKLTSYGQLDSISNFPTYDMPPEEADKTYFISLYEEEQLGREFWGGNAAVIDELEQELVQPSSFVRSCCGSFMDTLKMEEYLQVFFKTKIYVGQNGYVVFDAPSGFDFGQECMARDLPNRHYAFVGAEELKLDRLRAMNGCVGQKHPITEPTYNRAKIAVRGTINSQRYYGFEIRVLHPTTYAESQHYNWYLWLQDSNTFGLQGSRATMRFQDFAVQQTDFYHKSWGMYDELVNAIPLQILNTRPKAVTNKDTRIIFFPIKLAVDTTTSLRISAPLGFEWDDDMNTFIKRTNNTLDDFPVPLVQNKNQLVWMALFLKGNQNYGFQAKVTIPNFNPVVSANNFFIEFGFLEKDIEKRLHANVIEAPTINAITNATVTFSTNLVGYQDTRLEFAWRTVTPMTEGSGIVIKGSDKTAGFALGCPFLVLPESDAIPSDVQCHYMLASDSTPQISLLVGKTSMAPGFYSFEMKASNPPTLKLEAGTWKFGSYERAKDYPQANSIDMELDAVGFKIIEQMLGSTLIPLPFVTKQKTGRNDRPGKTSSVIFEFSLRKRPQSAQDMVLRAPRGFVFESNCMSGLFTEKNDVFGPNTEEEWPPAYTEWMPQYKPTRCVGEGREAAITIPVGLGKNTYAFRIGIKRTPDRTPEWNRWSLTFNDETSDPFEGFIIWTFTDMVVTPVGTQKSQTAVGTTRTEVPVRFKFTPFNRIPFKVTGQKYGGVLIFTAPKGFEFIQDKDICEAMLYTSDGSETYTPSEYACRVESKSRLLLYMAGNVRGLKGGVSYSLILFMYHPPAASVAAEWHMDTFSKWEAQQDTALDESVLMGYSINNVMNRFQAINTYQIPMGNTKLDDIDILLQFPDPLKDDDVVRVYAPKGFNLIGTPELADCNGFKWVLGVGPLPKTGAPTCYCDEQIACTLEWILDERKDPALAQNIDIHFKIATKNPSKTPFLMENYWKAAHLRESIIKSSHVQKSWNIHPQLEQVDVLLVGSSLAAGTDSDIELQFTPVTDADTLLVEAIFPTQFSFDQSTVAYPYEISTSSQGPRLIINRGGFKADVKTRIRVNTVRLGRAGGDTIFNFITYTDSTMLVKRDEKLQFEKGFRLPGLISIVGEPKLRSMYQSVPVKSLFQPRYLEEATVEFELSFSRPVQAAERLMITCQGQGAYELLSAPFVVVGASMIETSVEIDKDGAIKATLKPGRPATEVALEADTRYIVIFKVVPKKGTNTWRFDTSDGGELPSNTNDGRQQGFSPVEQMTLGISAVRNPPTAVVDVLLNIDPGDAVVRELIIIAPPGFSFDSSAGGCGDMCMPGAPLSTTDRKTASIASPTGEPLTALKGLRLRVLTPELTPSDVNWFVEGRGQGVGTTTGWGEGQGFFVTQMGGTTVTYPAVAGVRGAQIAFTFTLDVDAGTQIAIEPPKGFELTCSAEGSLAQISLPGAKPDCIDHPLQLRLSAPLRIGRYSFALGLNLPPETPAKNTFNIIIRDQDNNVVDAVYALPGMEIQNIGVSNPFLSWSKSEPGQKTTIEIGLTFTKDTLNVKALLIVLPDAFMHDVQNPTDFQNLNKRFPVASGSRWAETTAYPDRIRVYLDDTSGASGAVIQSGVYKFRFPALVPPEVSTVNVWSISLCNDRDCASANDKWIIVSFPIAGFNLYETAAEGVTQTAVTSASYTIGLSDAIKLLAVSFLLLSLAQQ